MYRVLRRGFTLVELLIVVVVIVILVRIVIVMFDGVQLKANNTKVFDAAVKVGDSLQLFYTKYGHYPIGGIGSTAALSGTECADGADGFISSGIYTCTVEDVLVANKYLTTNYSSSIPQNVNYAPTAANYAIYVRSTGVTTGKILVMYNIDSPSAADTTKFQTQVTKCGLTWASISTQRTTYGMQGGICIEP